MPNIQLDWEVEGSIEPKESMEGMLKVIGEKGEADNGIFWGWDGRVDIALERGLLEIPRWLLQHRIIPGREANGTSSCTVLIRYVSGRTKQNQDWISESCHDCLYSKDSPFSDRSSTHQRHTKASSIGKEKEGKE